MQQRGYNEEAMGNLSDKPEVFGIEECASVFDVHPKTIARWVRDGDLPAMKVGGSVVFRRDALDRWLRRGVWNNVPAAARPADLADDTDE